MLSHAPLIKPIREGSPMTMKIAILPGDGTGPEVVREALKVLDAVASAESFVF
jgi:3-isopropylmalate dehydrogenase